MDTEKNTAGRPADGAYTADDDSLMRVLRRLRAPDGCPWDRRQTRQSLIPCLESECAELIEAIDKEDVPNIREELGDLLMNVLFQVQIAEERGEFTLAEVWRGIIDKMISRHAHVFGDEHADNVAEVMAIWNRKKAEEAQHAAPVSVLDKVKHSLSPLTRAEKLQARAAEQGFDFPDAAAAGAKLTEELRETEEALASGDEAAVDEELGDLLFAAVNFIRLRRRGSADELLRAANRKFERRFRALEKLLAAGNREMSACSPAELDAGWEQIKQGEKSHEK